MSFVKYVFLHSISFVKYVFSQDNYDEDEVPWPILIDEFVDYLKEKEKK